MKSIINYDNFKKFLNNSNLSQIEIQPHHQDVFLDDFTRKLNHHCPELNILEKKSNSIELEMKIGSLYHKHNYVQLIFDMIKMFCDDVSAIIIGPSFDLDTIYVSILSSDKMWINKTIYCS
jgi:hypothetical protein